MPDDKLEARRRGTATVGLSMKDLRLSDPTKGSFNFDDDDTDEDKGGAAEVRVRKYCVVTITNSVLPQY